MASAMGIMARFSKPEGVKEDPASVASHLSFAMRFRPPPGLHATARATSDSTEIRNSVMGFHQQPWLLFGWRRRFLFRMGPHLATSIYPTRTLTANTRILVSGRTRSLRRKLIVSSLSTHLDTHLSTQPHEELSFILLSFAVFRNSPARPMSANRNLPQDSLQPNTHNTMATVAVQTSSGFRTGLAKKQPVRTSEKPVHETQTPDVVDPSRYLVTSPYTEQAHLLDLQSVNEENGLLALALVKMNNLREDYATAPYLDTFNWDEVIQSLRALARERDHRWRETSFYIVAFRSQIPPTTVYADLGVLDKAAHAEAVASGGFLK